MGSDGLEGGGRVCGQMGVFVLGDGRRRTGRGDCVSERSGADPAVCLPWWKLFHGVGVVNGTWWETG